jgi:thioredoxin-like negative regulator of GroEL
MDPSHLPRIPQGPTVVEVRTPWCHACAAMEPHLREVAAKHDGEVELVRIDASDDPDAASALGIRGTPTLIGYRNGEEVFRSVGRLTAHELDQLFTSVGRGSAPPRLGMQSVVIRVGAGVALMAVGLASGPVMPLVAIGAVATAFGFFTWLRIR